MKLSNILVMCVAAAFSLQAQASSTEAWNKSQKEIVQSCLKATHLKDTKAAGQIIDYSDDVGFSVLVLEGRYPQAFMNNQKGKELCLFQRSTRKAFVQTADDLLKKQG